MFVCVMTDALTHSQCILITVLPSGVCSFPDLLLPLLMSSRTPLCSSRPLYSLSNYQKLLEISPSGKVGLYIFTSLDTPTHHFHFHYLLHLLPPPDPSSVLRPSPVLFCRLLFSALQPTAVLLLSLPDQFAEPVVLCGRETGINYRDRGRGARNTQQIKDTMTEMEKGGR